MKEHEHFKAQILGAPQDISLPILQGLLAEGYDTVRWQTSASAVDAKCLELNDNVWPLEQFIAETQYDAPIFSHGHVGDQCSILVTGPGLPDKMVTAFGEVQ